ncbi:MAG: hypothetical protein JXA78_10270 [Anaerolineales bacterium]|nr:hypothetical protein [Anaerolineales bacterium]
MQDYSRFQIGSRLGFHYYPDSVHYRQVDLRGWLPELIDLGAQWVTLIAPLERAIPEFFLDGLLGAGIQPILHFQPPTDLSFEQRELDMLLAHYTRCGVRYVAFYDCPNSRANWQPSIWAQSDLVERFLDLYIPLAKVACKLGLTPIFPPLEPGGDYWDLAFLRTSLRSMKRRGCDALLSSLALGAYAWVADRPLNWGAGGAARWPQARPYLSPASGQDHRGFRIFDWYLEIARQELGDSLSILLLRAGSCPTRDSARNLQDGTQHALRNLSLARLAAGLAGEVDSLDPFPPEVLACNFWLLAADENSAHAPQAWFHSSDENLPVVDAFRRWVAGLRDANRAAGIAPQAQPETGDADRVDHYILLPLYSWGAAEWDLAAIQPLLRDSHPTIGFSLAEARRSTRVTVVGSRNAFSAEALAMLNSAGCLVERLLEDGTLVAT